MFLYILLLICIAASCEKNKSIIQADAPEFAELIVDTFQVQINIDITEGFKNPRLYHKIDFTGHLTAPGFIGDFNYSSQNSGYFCHYDFFSACPKWTPFHHNTILWKSELVDPGTRVPYTFAASSYMTENEVPVFIVDSAAVIKEVYLGPRPEKGSVQLTGSLQECYNPIYSKDMKWIYYKSYDRESHIHRIKRITADGISNETVIGFDDNSASLGSFTLLDNDTKLAYILWRANVKSKLIRYDLQSLSKDESILDGFIWDSKLIKLPQEQKYICKSDPNSGNGDADIVFINLEDNTVEKLILQSDVGYINSYDYRPNTNEITYSICRLDADNKLIGSTIYSYNMQNQETSVLIEHLTGTNLTWAPNYEDYAYLWDGSIYINKDGIDRQVTTYPGWDDFPNISSDGKEITFCGQRRDEAQIWKVEL